MIIMLCWVQHSVFESIIYFSLQIWRAEIFIITFLLQRLFNMADSPNVDGFLLFLCIYYVKFPRRTREVIYFMAFRCLITLHKIEKYES